MSIAEKLVEKIFHSNEWDFCFRVLQRAACNWREYGRRVFFDFKDGSSLVFIGESKYPDVVGACGWCGEEEIEYCGHSKECPVKEEV